MVECKHSQQSAGDSAFHMIDAGGRHRARRRAVAQGAICLGERAFEAVKKINAKGYMLALGETAGIITAELAGTEGINALKDIFPHALHIGQEGDHG